MAEHTPGPWHLGLPGGPQGPFYCLVNSQGNVVAPQIVGTANARLIAAAPEMLECLKVFLAPDDLTAWDIGMWSEQARRVVARAEGKQP